tara:strand:- start:11 stop:220 length:210 start_codon:yes stop_codon:yes gene_type:complete
MGIIKIYNKDVIKIVLNVKTSSNPKNSTILNNKNIVVFLLTTIFLKEYVGILLIKSTEIIRIKIGTNIL